MKAIETTEKPPYVLFVDDDELFARATLHSLLRIFPLLTCDIVTSASACLAKLNEVEPDVAIVDLSLDDLSGIDSGLLIISQILAASPCTRVIVLTGQASYELGAIAIERGAASFLAKPPKIDFLATLIRDGVQYARLKKGYRQLPTSSEDLCKSVGLSSRNSAMRKVFESIAFAAFNKSPVLIYGETGSGKGVVAEAIHKLSRGSDKSKFLRFQPSYGSHDLIASELFGHKRGSFTGATEERKGLLEEAHLGTLFIDEIDELPTSTQVTLLNVLQEKVFRPIGSNRDLRSDFRLVSATNRNIEEVLVSGKMRTDFYHRIAHHIITLPPLRERKEDIIDLSDSFLKEVVNRGRHQIQGFTPGAIGRLITHPWPGNVRELLAVVENAVALAAFRRKRYVDSDELAISLDSSPKASRKGGLSFREQVRDFELQLIADTLAKFDQNQTEAARYLDLDRSTMRRIIARNK